MSRYILEEPKDYSFEDRSGHSGKKFQTLTTHEGALIIECDDALTVSLRENECDFSYYVIQGSGYFVFNDGERESVEAGNLVSIPAGTKFTFGGKLKMLLVNAPGYNPEQEETFKRNDI